MRNNKNTQNDIMLRAGVRAVSEANKLRAERKAQFKSDPEARQKTLDFIFGK